MAATPTCGRLAVVTSVETVEKSRGKTEFMLAQVLPDSKKTKPAARRGAIWARPASERRLRCSDCLAIRRAMVKKGVNASYTYGSPHVDLSVSGDPGQLTELLGHSRQVPGSTGCFVCGALRTMCRRLSMLPL